ncbi:MAG: diphthine--ammonia ligase [Oscillospiraceae bacterium]|nr:diphthine--ammonia ligase [Oscillospiraceae bacterium]
MDVAVSYSGGKDGALALYRARQLGHTPRVLLTTFNDAAELSWFHGVPEELLRRSAEAAGLELKLIRCGFGDDYARDFIAALDELRAQGIEGCVFGDIDIQQHFDWSDGVCRSAGLQSFFPLWQQSRRDLVYESVDSGFRALITNIDTTRLSARFLGMTLSRELAEEIAAEGADICGENGEYHTFVYDGPIFRHPVPFTTGEPTLNNGRAVLPVLPD